MKIDYIHFERNEHFTRNHIIEQINNCLKEEEININDVISITENLNEITVYYKSYVN